MKPDSNGKFPYQRAEEEGYTELKRKILHESVLKDLIKSENIILPKRYSDQQVELMGVLENHWMKMFFMASILFKCRKR